MTSKDIAKKGKINNEPGRKLRYITFGILGLIIFYWVTLSVLTHLRLQEIMNSAEVISFSSQVKSKYPKCSKIIDVHKQYSVGDSSYEYYILQYNRLNGCEFNKIEFQRSYGSTDEFTMYTDKDINIAD